MYDEIIDNLSKQLSIDEMKKITSSKLHLGIFNEPCLSYMLNGKKTIESRFSKNKILPYEKISEDDIVIVKASGGKVVAYFTIKKVIFFDLKYIPIEDIKNKYNKELCVDDNFWELKKHSNYATLIFIDKLVKLEPFKVNKKGMNTWLMIKEG